MLNEAVLYRLLLETKGQPPFPRFGDREAWQAVSGRPAAAQIRELAAKAAGRVWSICEESSWVVPAHLRGAVPDVDGPWIDLFASGTAIDLAETDYLLGDLLPATVRTRIRLECRRRMIEPYLRRCDFWWLGPTGQVNNWNPASQLGVVAAALYLCDDAAVQARVLAKVLAHLPAYLKSFDADGCTSEGVKYWSGGFGKYFVLAHLVESRLPGCLDLLEGERFRRICRYPVMLEMSPGHFVNFSDSDEETTISAGIACALGRRCGVPALEEQGLRTTCPWSTGLSRGRDVRSPHRSQPATSVARPTRLCWSWQVPIRPRLGWSRYVAGCRCGVRLRLAR